MVLPFRRVEAEAGAGYALYGKLPNRPDFVRINANHPAITEFDELIQRALELLASQEDWSQSYDRGGPVAFQFVSNDLRYTLSGVLAPSRDQAGRRYPLLAVAIAPSESIAGSAHIAPIANEVFFDGLSEQVGNAIDNSVEALSCSQFLESQLRSDPALTDLDLARSVVSRFMATTPAARLSKLLEDGAGGVRLEQALLNLAFYRAFLRRFDNAATNQAILLPLPHATGEQALVACAWLSIIGALCDGRSSSPAWAGNYAMLQNNQEKTVLATCFNKIHDKFATLMMGGEHDPAFILALGSEQEAWRDHRLYSEVSYALGRLLGDPALSIKGLCEFLQDVGQKLKDTI